MNSESFKVVRSIINSRSAKIRFNGEKGNVSRTITKTEKIAMAETIDYFRHLRGIMKIKESEFSSMFR